MADDVVTETKKRRFSQRISNDKLKNQSDLEDTNICSPYFNNLKFKKRRTENSDNKSVAHLINLDNSISQPVNIHINPTLVSRRKLGRTFYDLPAEELAKKLLGKHLYRLLPDGNILSARIIETEGYLGVTDKACHTFGGKRTARTEPMFMPPGTVYVYFIYGMHFCMNISSKDIGGAVLIRALEPVEGIERMKELRGNKQSPSKGLKDFQLCDGPSKLCRALNITKDNLNKEDMVTSKDAWIEEDSANECNDVKIVTSTRIGVNSYGQDAALKPLRFYILGNKCVSVRDKKAEEMMCEK